MLVFINGIFAHVQQKTSYLHTGPRRYCTWHFPTAHGVQLFCTCAESCTSAHGLHIDFFSISKTSQLYEDKEVYKGNETHRQQTA
jgi:hypothetical protein